MKYVISAVVFVILFSAAIGAAEVNTTDLYSVDYTDVFCGRPLPFLRSAEPVVVPPHDAPVTVPVSIFQFEFLPTNLTINVGDTVMWSNDDALPHTTTGNTGVWNSGMLQPGQTYSRTFNSPGDFPYHCNFHFFMTANITVLAPSPTPTSTPTDTPTNTATPTPTAPCVTAGSLRHVVWRRRQGHDGGSDFGRLCGSCCNTTRRQDRSSWI